MYKNRTGARKRTGEFYLGAGKIWWVPVGGVERVRTGEKDLDALTTTVDKKISNMPISFTSAIDTPCS